MRLFVAVNLPPEERDGIHKASGVLRERGLPVRWLDPGSYHLTLKFLGEIRAYQVGPIQEILARVASGCAPFRCSIGGFGAFPSVRRPSVLWLGVEPSPALRCLKQDVEWALAEAGFERETRAFHPHLTLGRVDRENGAGAFRGLDDLLAELPYAGAMDVTSFDLMRSHLSREGARYSVLSTHPLSPP